PVLKIYQGDYGGGDSLPELISSQNSQHSTSFAIFPSAVPPNDPPWTSNDSVNSAPIPPLAAVNAVEQHSADPPVRRHSSLTPTREVFLHSSTTSQHSKLPNNMMQAETSLNGEPTVSIPTRENFVDSYKVFLKMYHRSNKDSCDCKW